MSQMILSGSMAAMSVTKSQPPAVDHAVDDLDGGALDVGQHVPETGRA